MQQNSLYLNQFHSFLYSDRTNRAFIFLISFALFIAFGKSPFFDPDTGWHVRAGDYIISSMSVPYKDPWSFTADQQWYNLSWLYDVLLYGLFSVGNGIAIYYGLAFICAFLLSELYRILDYFGEYRYDTKLAAVAMAGLLLHPVAIMRPQILCYLWAMYVMLILHISRKDSKKLIYLIPLTLLWVNMHGSFLIVFVLMGVHFLEALVSRDVERCKKLIIYGIICAICTLINPIGYKIYIGVDRTMDSAISKFLMEWQPWNFNWSGAVLLPIAMIIGLPMIFGVKKASFTERMMTFFWLMMTFKSIRFVGMLGIFSAPLVAAIIEENMKQPKFKIPDFFRWALAVVLLTSHSFIKDWWIPRHEFNDHRVAISYLLQHYKGQKIFNDYTLGGQIIFIGNGQVSHFIDGRAGTAYSEKFILDYLDFAFARKKSIDEYLSIYGNPNVAIIKLNSGEGGYLDGLFRARGWKQVYRDNLTVIYENVKTR